MSDATNPLEAAAADAPMTSATSAADATVAADATGNAAGDAASVIDFWHRAGPSRWFQKDDAFDADFRARFMALHEQAAAHGLDRWATEPTSALALLILLDQFPRNAFRGAERMFATDAHACRVATSVLDIGFDRSDLLDPALRPFFYMPFMHSEQLADQERCVFLMRTHAPDNLPFAIEHHEIIQRFGRFPHRNAVLGRDSTPAEQAFLEAGGFSG